MREAVGVGLCLSLGCRVLLLWYCREAIAAVAIRVTISRKTRRLSIISISFETI